MMPYAHANMPRARANAKPKTSSILPLLVQEHIGCLEMEEEGGGGWWRRVGEGGR